MKCPKCGSADRIGNFCNNCGTFLKEKCSECGEMEYIGRPICETRIKKINEQVSKFVDAKMNPRFWQAAGALLGGLLLVMTAAGISHYIKPTMVDLIITMVGTASFFYGLGIMVYMDLERPKREARRNFLALHPDYKELLDKQEAWEKAQREEDCNEMPKVQ